MRTTSIQLISSNSEAIEMDLRPTVAKSRFLIRNIVGLDAEEIIPRFYGFNIDGTKRFHDFRMKARDLVIRIQVNPRLVLNETNSDVRDELYKAISSSRTGELEVKFFAGASAIAHLFGHVVKFETAYFTAEPEVQLTIRCNDPMFRGVHEVVIPPGEIATTNPLVVTDNYSTAPHGFYTSFEITDTMADLEIYDKEVDPDWSFKVVPASTFLAGDEIFLSSEFGARQLYMVRSAVTTHLLDRVTTDSVWPMLFPGYNELHFPDIADITWNAFSYFPAYWGV